MAGGQVRSSIDKHSSNTQCSLGVPPVEGL